ncbi:MAG: hypothetical protein ACJ8H8_24440, partial [Geminicoccaceae bacterium]
TTTLPRLPPHSCALIIEDEPVQGFALECALEELGCRPVGPASTVEQVEKLIEHERPNFALLEGHMLAKSLQALGDCLEHHEVSFAILDIGDETGGLLPGRPRLRRPFHLPDLSAMSTVLLRTDLESKIATADRRIAEGVERLASQVRRVERLEQLGADTATAMAISRETARGLQLIRQSRQLLVQQFSALPDGTLPAPR